MWAGTLVSAQGQRSYSNATFSAALIVGSSVFAASLFGIYTRPVGFLATVWPANALMLGLLLRVPNSSGPFGWIAGTIGFLTADLLTGSTLFKTILLTAGNLAGIGAAYFTISLLSAETTRLKTPISMLNLVVACANGGMCAGVVGSIANPILFGGSAIAGWTFWFATEFVNYLAILPVILSAPRPSDIRPPNLAFSTLGKWKQAAPTASLLVSCVAGIVIGGPGAIAFPVPALLWCSLTYSIFVTAALTLIFIIWTLLSLSGGYLPGAFDLSDENAIISIRLGVALVALAPVMLASAMASRTEILNRMKHLATRDHLTGVLNRGAFRDEATERLANLAPSGENACVLLIDVDRFKSINDERGHAAGDLVLAVLTERLAQSLRQDDILGRMGGEEFAALLPCCSMDNAIDIAERIRRSLDDYPIRIGEGQAITATVSIGISESNASVGNLDQLLHEADLAMYRAKETGRNRVVRFWKEPSC